MWLYFLDQKSVTRQTDFTTFKRNLQWPELVSCRVSEDVTWSCQIAKCDIKKYDFRHFSSAEQGTAQSIVIMADFCREDQLVQLLEGQPSFYGCCLVTDSDSDSDQWPMRLATFSILYFFFQVIICGIKSWSERGLSLGAGMERRNIGVSIGFLVCYQVLTSVLNVAACSLQPGSPLTKVATWQTHRHKSQQTAVEKQQHTGGLPQ